MKLVCRICGYDEDERRRDGCCRGRCKIPREVGKSDKMCLMNAKSETMGYPDEVTCPA